jgi:hypothetical protein
MNRQKTLPERARHAALWTKHRDALWLAGYRAGRAARPRPAKMFLQLIRGIWKDTNERKQQMPKNKRNKKPVKKRAKKSRKASKRVRTASY